MISRVAVIGTGLMGSGIGFVVAKSGIDVTFWCRKGEKGLDRFKARVQQAREKKFLSPEQVTSLLTHIEYAIELKEAVKDSDLVIEAVVEDLKVKKEIFAKINRYSSLTTIISSNTSSLSIKSLSNCTARKARIVGLHFFNPAPVMQLVEVVKTDQTSEETINEVIVFLQKINKIPLIVKDYPGFIVNRLLMPTINRAAFLKMDGVASSHDIDLAMTLGANHKMGPLATADLIGIDVCVGIIKQLYNSYQTPDFEVCPLLEEMVAKGDLGRKTGKGFFRYDSQKQP